MAVSPPLAALLAPGSTLLVAALSVSDTSAECEVQPLDSDWDRGAFVVQLIVEHQQQLHEIGTGYFWTSPAKCMAAAPVCRLAGRWVRDEG